MLRLACCLLVLSTLAEAGPDDPHRLAYDKMTLAKELAHSKRDLPRALTLAKEALPELSGDPIAVATYCGVLLDARTLPGIDQQLDDCIAHLYVLDPVGMESNSLGARVAALRGHRELAHQRLDVAKKAGLPDAEYTQLAAQIDGRSAPMPAPAPSHSIGKMIVAFAAGAVGTAALVLIGLRLSRKR